MAKSIRSKWKRKMRAIKRVRYGKKELDRLKKTLGVQDSAPSGPKDVVMEEISEVANIVTATNIKKKTDVKSWKRMKEVTVSSEIGDIKEVNTEALKDEKGLYPVWLHPRKIKKFKKKAGIKKKAKAKKSKRGTYKKNQKKKQELLSN